MTSTTARWSEVLDAIEHDAETCVARFIRGDDVDALPCCEPPVDIGPLPAELEPRARAVLARVREVEAMLERIPRPGLTPRPHRFGTSDDVGSTFTRRV